MDQRCKNGFSLVELMVTVAILGILASFAAAKYRDFKIKAERTEAFVHVNAIRKFLIIYLNDTGMAPIGISPIGSQLCNGGGCPNFGYTFDYNNAIFEYFVGMGQDVTGSWGLAVYARSKKIYAALFPSFSDVAFAVPMIPPDPSDTIRLSGSGNICIVYDAVKKEQYDGCPAAFEMPGTVQFSEDKI